MRKNIKLKKAYSCIVFIATLTLLVFDVPSVKCELGSGGVNSPLPAKSVDTNLTNPIDASGIENAVAQRVILSKFTGGVKVVKSGQTNEMPARKNMVLTGGDTIATVADGKAIIVFSDGSVITLKENSVFIIEKALRDAGSNTYISQSQLKFGQLRAKIKSQKKESSFKVSTPTSVCGVLGTVFFLKVFPDTTGAVKSVVFVQEGKVYFYDVSGQYGHVIQELGSFDSSMFGTREEPAQLTEEQISEWLEGWGISEEGALAFGDEVMIDFNNINSNGGDYYDKNSEKGFKVSETRFFDVDSDGDGLYDLEETLIYHTDPVVADSDNDGLNDGAEVNTYETNPNDSDSDDDNITDGEEVNTYLTDPNKSDTDNDTYSDYDEIVAGSDPLLAEDTPLDTDGDGIRDYIDKNNNDGPLGDMDGDGIKNNVDPDDDNDLLTDIQEAYWGTDRLLEDTDNDGNSDIDDAFPMDSLLSDSRNQVRSRLLEILRGELLRPEIQEILDYSPDEDANYDPANPTKQTNMPGWHNRKGESWNTGGYVYYPISGTWAWWNIGNRYTWDAMYERDLLRADIDQLIANNEIRAMDDRMVRISDAQMGKVMTDVHGNRVRIEQYILRPDTSMVQILSINLRSSSARDTAGNDISGLTTLDWTTKFNREVSHSELKSLPWQDYLTVVTDNPAHKDYYITSTDTGYQTNKPTIPYLDEMTISFSHNNDNITEYTDFGNHGYSGAIHMYRQRINRYALSVNGTTLLSSMVDFVNNTTSTTGNPAGFNTIFSNGNGKNKHTYEISGIFNDISDDGLLSEGASHTIKNMMDVLRVGFCGLSDGHNLELSLDIKKDGTSMFSSPIDMVISPFADSKWQWNDDIEW